MAEPSQVLEYKCPCCEAGLIFGQDTQKLNCESCGNEFEFEAVREYNQMAQDIQEDAFCWDEEQIEKWNSANQDAPFFCPSCGGLIDTDAHTAATFCPYCDNPVVLPERTGAFLKPDAVIPFKNSKQDAQKAFRALCKGKLLLPKDFMSEHRVNKIIGCYVPFWLYSCSAELRGKYRTTRIHRWSDSQYNYTKTDYFLLNRAANAQFDRIPMDGSTKMDDKIMESIEPYDYSQMVDFDNAYLSGFLADKYDVEAKCGEDRVRSRVSATMDEMIAASCIGYASVIPASKNLNIQHSKAKYVLLPVWKLQTKYKDQVYTFAMNGQTGKMTGTFPICPKRSAAWFIGICAAVTALVSLIQLIVL